jgi:hypothetical protein
MFMEVVAKKPALDFLELRKTTKKLNQDSRSPVRYLNPGPPEYEAGIKFVLNAEISS